MQRALQDAQVSLSSASAKQDMTAWADQTTKVNLLQEDLVSMLSVARRRKSVFEGVSMDFEVGLHRRKGFFIESRHQS